MLAGRQFRYNWSLWCKHNIGSVWNVDCSRARLPCMCEWQCDDAKSIQHATPAECGPPPEVHASETRCRLLLISNIHNTWLFLRSFSRTCVRRIIIIHVFVSRLKFVAMLLWALEDDVCWAWRAEQMKITTHSEPLCRSRSERAILWKHGLLHLKNIREMHLIHSNAHFLPGTARWCNRLQSEQVALVDPWMLSNSYNKHMHRCHPGSSIDSNLETARIWSHFCHCIFTQHCVVRLMQWHAVIERSISMLNSHLIRERGFETNEIVNKRRRKLKTKHRNTHAHNDMWGNSIELHKLSSRTIPRMMTSNDSPIELSALHEATSRPWSAVQTRGELCEIALWRITENFILLFFRVASGCCCLLFKNVYFEFLDKYEH